MAWSIVKIKIVGWIIIFARIKPLAPFSPGKWCEKDVTHWNLVNAEKVSAAGQDFPRADDDIFVICSSWAFKYNDTIYSAPFIHVTLLCVRAHKFHKHAVRCWIQIIVYSANNNNSKESAYIIRSLQIVNACVLWCNRGMTHSLARRSLAAEWIESYCPCWYC